MELSKQCCTLRQAKRLKELGVNQCNNTYYFYEEFVNSRREMVLIPLWVRDWSKDEDNDSITDALSGESKNEVYSAFTVAEFGVMLPTAYDTMRTIESKGELWQGYDDNGDDFPKKSKHKTEAEARAAMLIHLLEKKVLSADEVNERLVA